MTGVGYSDDCLACSTSHPACEGSPCQNGCTASPDSISGVFDFRDACCNHDYCYGSWYPKAICDDNFFYVFMNNHCNSRPWYQRPLCYSAATTYYNAVSLADSNNESHAIAARYARNPSACSNGGIGKHIPPGGVPDEGQGCLFDNQCYGYCDGGQCRDGSPADPCASNLDCWAGTNCLSGTCS